MDTFKTILFPNIVFRFLSLAFRQARPQRCFRLDKSNKIALNTLYQKKCITFLFCYDKVSFYM